MPTPGLKQSRSFQVFATDVNNLFVTDSFLGYATAVKARLVLKKPHPVFGFVNGKAAYGIRRVRFRRAGDNVHERGMASENYR